MNRDLRGWAEVRVSHLTGHKLVTQEVNVINWWKKRGGLVNLTCPQTLQNLVWTFPFSSLCYICPTLFLQSLSEQAKCASPGKKGNAPKNQIPQVELSTERGYSTTPCGCLGRGRQTKCCLQGVLRQLTNDRTPPVHHTLGQSAIEKTTATASLRGAWSTESLGLGGPKLAIPPNRLSLFLSIRILWNVKETWPDCAEPWERPTMWRRGRNKLLFGSI